MAVWELHPASNKKLVVSLDADTEKEAIAKAKKLVYEREGKRYRKWMCSQASTPELLVESEEDKKEKEGIKKQRR